MKTLANPSVVLVSAAVAGFAGLLFLPLWVNQVIVEYSVSDAAGGYLAAAEFTAVAISALLAASWLRRPGSRRTVVWGFVLLVLGNLLAAASSSIPPLVAGRVLAGLGSGIVLAYVHAAIAYTHRPDRLFAVMNFSIISVGVLAYAVFTQLLLKSGTSGIFLLMCGLAAVCFVPVAAGTESVWRRSDGVLPVGGRIPGNHRIVLLGVLAFYIAEGTLWAYLIRLATVAGVSTADAAYLISSTLALGLLGALLAGAIDKRVGRAMPIAATLACLAAVAWALGNGSSAFQYSAAVVTLNFAFVIVVVSTSGLLAELDASGRLAAKIPMLRTVGNALGPWIGAMIVEFSGYGTLGWVVAAVYLVSATLLYAPARRLDYYKPAVG